MIKKQAWLKKGVRIDNRKNFLPAQRGVESPGFVRVGCGHKGEVFWDRRGSRRPRPSPALSLLLVSEVIQAEGAAGAERDRGGRSGFTHSFSGYFLECCPTKQARSAGSWTEQWPHGGRPMVPPTSASVLGRSFRGGAVGAGLERKSHFFRQN